MRITYNAPIILTYTLVCVIVQVLPQMTVNYFFALDGSTNLGDPFDYLRMFTHVIGHGGWGHLIGNFSLILLIGPLVEEKYGSQKLLMMIVATALITGLLNNFFFSSGLLGASGVVFMLILLGSITNMKAGQIPLTFILVALLYVGREVMNVISTDNISQFAHIIGGVCGAAFGFALGTKSNTEEGENMTGGIRL